MLLKPLFGLFVLAAAPLTPAGAQTTTAPAEKPHKTRLHQRTVSVPMEFWGPRPVVHARINGKGPFRLDVDTGTSLPAVIDDDVLRKLGVPVPEKVPALGAVEDAAPVRVASLTIGGAEFSDVPIIPADFAGFLGAGPDTPVGIIGLPLFKDCLITFDYPARQFVFTTGELPASGENTLPYSPNPQADFGVTVEIKVAGHPVKAHIDTGSPASVTLLTKWKDKLPLAAPPRVLGRARTPSGETTVYAATLDGVVQIGSLTFERPKINFADLGPMETFDCGNIGSALLNDFAMTIDQKNRRVQLHRGSPKK